MREEDFKQITPETIEQELPQRKTITVMASSQERTGRNPIKSYFAAFMAGSLVVGGLMFASDKMNLFTGENSPVASASTAPAAGTSAGSGITTASLPVSGDGSIADIVKEASPAVVKIETKSKTSASRSSISNNPLYRQFFGDNGGSGESGSSGGQNGGDSLQATGIGSGFIFDSSGYILTNQHVIDGADEIDVTVQGYDTPFKAKLLGSSYDLDLAVLKIEGDKAFPSLTIGNSDNAQVGDWLVAIGNPYDYDYSVTTGILSAKDRPITIQDEEGTRNYKHLIQTDTAINPGNSGGPLLNMKGEVIGINTAVNSEAQGIGFAIPASTVSSVLDKLKNNVSIPKEGSPYIGVSVRDLTQDLAGELNLKDTAGALVADVQPGTPAYQAGIRQYDVIQTVNGSSIADASALTKQIQSLKTGDTVKLTVVRNGQSREVSVVVGDKNTLSQQTNP